ncbi:hypothetical protein QFC21_003599 [Naganishia friedmannii]|uniref:Uncharacterized protein n=1 Tax=Naganishia friedmannii TaxID=89922 RepID=A0ACC2VPL6_9TREE|nr:hypothetical protein QFC21_003599 [Naganishia friedmannii]
MEESTHANTHGGEMGTHSTVQENEQGTALPTEVVLDDVADDNDKHNAHSRPTPPTLHIPPTEILARSSEIEQTHAPDSPTTMLITTLRDELMTLTDQSTVLNSKLIASLDRVANLEDTVYHKTSVEQQKDQLIEELEKAKAQWEESMNTGLLVERKSVKEEMQRLVDGLVEEERRRGSAEEGRQRVENEVDDLSATLFEQANTMVAAERMARAQAETRLRQAEENLQAAEAAMRDMQHHLQSLPTLLPPADVGPSSSLTTLARGRTYTTTHVPYAEFIAFIQHIRLHKPRKPEHVALLPAPSLTTLLSQPFIARSQVEDIDPALRLEQAPDLSWLTRRSVTQAILAGELVIEPVSVNTLKGCKEYASMHPADIACSMCGKPVVRKPAYEASENGEQVPPPKHPSTTRNNSTSRFSLKPFFSSPSASPSPSSSPAPTTTTPRSAPAPTTLFVFRITTQSDSSTADASSSGRTYPLCASGWCLARLRAVCEWWRFVRISMIEVIWRGDDGYALALSQQGQHRRISTGLPASKRASVNGSTSVPVTPVHERNGTPVPSVSTEEVSQSSSITLPTNVQPEVPLLPKKKSGWSLGFKNLGGGNKGLGLAATKPEPATAPPAAVENAGSESSVEFTPVDVTPVDITPLAITTTAPPPPSIDVNVEQPVSPTDIVEDAPRVAHSEGAGDHDENEEHAHRRPTSFADSQTSGENTNAFNTPESTSAPLSPEQNVTETVAAPTADHVSIDVTEGNAPLPAEVAAVELSSPLPRAEDATPAPPADEPGRSAPPTPTRPGRRAAPVPPPPGQEQANPSIAPKKPAVPQRSRARPASLTLNERNTHTSISSPGKVKDVAEEDTSREVDDGKMDVTMVNAPGGFITPDPSAGSLSTLVAPTPTRSAHAPALPPRTSMEKRGSLQSPGIRSKDEEMASGGTQEEVDSWESKTWREVVRLKEEIWKARVGVSEES